MSVVALRRMTASEEAVIELAETGLLASGDEARRAAIALLKREGLPNRRVEAWHYTDLRSLIERRPSVSGEALPQDDVFVPLLPNSAVIEAGRPAGAVPDGVSVESTGESPKWDVRVNHLDRDFDTVRLLTTALGASGISLAIADGTHVAQPIELRGETTETGERAFTTCRVGDNASATIVERLPPTRERAVSAAVSHLIIGDGAEVLWIIDQARGAGETHLGQLNVSLGKDAKFRLFALNAGAALVRQEVHTVTAGTGGEIVIRGVNLIEDGQHIDVTTSLNHTVEHTTATEVFRNVVLGGHGVFQGIIRVARGAQKTDAKLACNTLLLTDDGDFSVKPELEIFADDVLCGHGATVSEIDANHLFYLMSRGVPKAQARALLVRAFVDEVVEEFEDEAIVGALEARIDAWLERAR